MQMQREKSDDEGLCAGTETQKRKPSKFNSLGFNLIGLEKRMEDNNFIQVIKLAEFK